MDPQQRYCVNCAARRGNGANPSSRYFAAMSKRTRPPLVRPAAKQSPTSRAAAVGFFALLPIAVAIGVAIGNNGSGDGEEEALLKALRERQATAASTTAATPTGTSATAATGKAKKKAAKAGKANAKPEEKVVAHTANGDVHDVTHFKASEEKEAEDTKLVEENPEQTGENYIKAQQNLPDVIVVGGEGGGSAPAGVEP
jgi:ABC-type Na+ efflux pump permease subunit